MGVDGHVARRPLIEQNDSEQGKDMSRRLLTGVIATGLASLAARADFTTNIMLTGYWPQTNNMLRRFSTNPEQNPDGWTGQNWEDRGYDIYSFFPEFPDGLGKGVGDFEVDYQDTSEDFWRCVEELHPVAIITFGRGNLDRSWEVEWQTRNLDSWVGDYEEPYQPTPSPPDSSVPVDTIRYSTLPMEPIVDAVNAAYEDITLDAYVDYTGFAGGFLCEYVGYHASWYHDLHSDPDDPYWNVAAGHIHVGADVGRQAARTASRITLRELIAYVDTQVPEPGSLGLMLVALGAGLVGRRRL
jgi:pyrrolidone-carboxylate peptidase